MNWTTQSEALDTRCPPEIRELLSRQDGGPPNYCVVANVLVPPYAGVGNSARYGLIAELKHLKGIVVFASDGNAWFGLDYRTNPTCPSVVYWSEYDGRFEDDDDTPYELAPSFAAFLAMCGTEDTLNLDE
jgi:hypothetical protein